MERDWQCYRGFLDILERHYNQFPEHAHWTPRSEVRQRLEVQYVRLAAMGTTLRNWLLDMGGWPQYQYQPRHRTPPSAPREIIIPDSSEEIESDPGEDSEVSPRKRRWQE